MPGVYTEERWTRTPPPGCEAAVPEHRRAHLRAAPPVPERAEPDRDPGRHERRPDLRLEVQHPDRGHRATTPSDVQIEGQKIEAERDPRRPRRRRLPEELHGRVLGLQQHLRARDERVPHRHDRLALQPRVRDPLVHLRPRDLRELRRLVQRRLGRLPGLRAQRPPRAAGRARPRVRDHHPQLQLAPQHDRDVGHGRQRHVGARQPLPPQRDRASRPTRSRAATPACRRTTRSGRTT